MFAFRTGDCLVIDCLMMFGCASCFGGLLYACVLVGFAFRVGFACFNLDGCGLLLFVELVLLML